MTKRVMILLLEKREEVKVIHLKWGAWKESSADSNLTERLRKFDVAKSALQTAISQRAFLTQPQ